MLAEVVSALLVSFDVILFVHLMVNELPAVRDHRTCLKGGVNMPPQTAIVRDATFDSGAAIRQGESVRSILARPFFWLGWAIVLGALVLVWLAEHIEGTNVNDLEY